LSDFHVFVCLVKHAVNRVQVEYERERQNACAHIPRAREIERDTGNPKDGASLKQTERSERDLEGEKNIDLRR
jgi:hypothetical protein